MKNVTPENVKVIAKIVDKKKFVFDASSCQKIKTVLQANIDASALGEMNAALAAQKRRQLDYDDLMRIAYIHIRSILENGGESPYARVVAVCKKQGHIYDTRHIGIVTGMLLAMEFLTLLDAKFKPGKCKVYGIPDDVKLALSIPVTKPTHT